MSRLSISVILLLATGGVLSIKKSTDNVVFIVELARHGARAPIHQVYEVDWVKYAGIGELTPVGQRQRYLLGLNTKERYPLFFNNRLKYNEYWTRSTFFNRTIMSAFSHHMGIFDGYPNLDLDFENDNVKLYPPQELLVDPATFKFRTPLPNNTFPRPIHAPLASDPDRTLYLDGNPCPKNWAQVEKSLEEAEQVLNQSPKFLELLNKTFERYKLPVDWERGVMNVEKCFRLGDFAIMDFQNNVHPMIDPIKDKELYALLERCYSLKIYHSYEQMKVAKIAASPVLNQIRTWFKMKANMTKEQFPLRYVQYSAHDDTISSHLKVLGMADSDCIIKDLQEGQARVTPECPNSPPVASQILWELIHLEGKYYVKVSYNGEYVDYCKNGYKMGGDFVCSFDEFSNILDSDYVYADYASYCEFDRKPDKIGGGNALVIALGIIVLLLSIVTVTLLLLVQKYRQALDSLPSVS